MDGWLIICLVVGLIVTALYAQEQNAKKRKPVRQAGAKMLPKVKKAKK
jgi:hypothetical protein